MIQDVHPGSQILIFTFPGIPVSKGQKGTGSRIRNTEYNK